MYKMPRLKNKINDKDRKLQCVVTSNTVVYKIPIGEELSLIGTGPETDITDGILTIRYSTKKEATGFRIEKFAEPQQLSFS